MPPTATAAPPPEPRRRRRPRILIGRTVWATIFGAVGAPNIVRRTSS